MYVVIRKYDGQGAAALFDALVENEQEVRELIASVPGFVSYEAFRSDAGGETVTVCEEKAGTDESSRRAAAWVKENLGMTVEAPEITEGRTVLHF
jgi:antibiotic biosynthesis monooxygenase